MSTKDISEEKEIRELYVLKNPFREENLLNIVISSQPIYSDQPGLPINGKVYTIPRNEVKSDYVINSLSDETVSKSLSGNVATILKIQNNQTEILTYIVNVLFNEVSNPIKEMLKRIKQEVQNLQTQPISNDEPLEGINLEIGSLRSELEAIKDEIRKTNNNLEKLLDRIRDPPRVADQLQTIIDLLRQSTAETHKKLTQIDLAINNKPSKPYKYQKVIDYLKKQGREEASSSEPVTLENKCLTSQEAISILQGLIEEQNKTKCLTKEELISFFRKSAPTLKTPLEPPFRK